MDPTVDLLIKSLSPLMNQYFWWFVVASAAFFFKGMIENFVASLQFKFSRDFSVDDEVYIGGTKRARIVRQTLFKTVFYIYDTNRRLIIPNIKIHNLQCEKVLPTDSNPLDKPAKDVKENFAVFDDDD